MKMSRDVNKVILLGRLGADPVRRETKNGRAVVNFPLATSRRTAPQEEGGEAGTETVWHRVVAWGKDGENCAQFLRKGEAVFVEGSFRSRKYAGKDGVDRYSYEVHAEQVKFLPGAPLGPRRSAPAEHVEALEGMSARA
jgi:single-strand DNA-binding protein